MSQFLPTPKGNITIRISTAEDAEALFSLRMEALAAHPEAFAADVEMTRARGAEAWRNEIINTARDDSGVIIVALAGQQLIGMTGIGRGHWPKTRHSAIVWGVYVTPTWRGLRIAEAIIDEGITWASTHGIIMLKLGVVTNNIAAIRLYERCGFTIYGTEPKSNYLNGIYFDEYLMVRLINERK